MRSNLALCAALLAAAACGRLPPLVTVDSAPPPALLFAGVRVFDGERALDGPQDVLVVGERIARVGPAGSVEAPAGAVRIEGEGRTLLPGLFDAHVHVGGGNGEAPWDARLPDVRRQLHALLYAGVTSALNAGFDAPTPKLVRKIEAGRLSGPHLLACTHLVTARGGHPVPLYRALAPWPLAGFAIRRAVRQVDPDTDPKRFVEKELGRTGATFLKLVYDAIPDGAPRLTFEQLRGLIEAAHALGHRAVVHVGSPQEALDAIRAGADLLMHTPWSAPLDDAAVAEIARSKIPLVTTRRIYGVLAAGLKGRLELTGLERAVADPKRIARLGPKPEGWGEAIFDAAYLARLPEWDANLGENLKKLHAAGVTLIAGTDSGLPGLFHGPALHRELEALVDLGFSNEEVLRMATSLPAKILEPGSRRGRIEAGAIADLLLVDGDPLTRITDTRRIAGVWTAGHPVHR